MSSFLKRLLSGRIERVAPEENFFISSGMEFYGDLVARSSSGRIDGRFEGQIIECRKIIVGPDALIKGNIFAEDIHLYGHCEGNLYATGDVKVFDSGVMLGDIHATSLLVEKDSTFRGNVKKLKGQDMAEHAAREKEKIIRQGRSNVHNIYSLKARTEAEASKALKVANGTGYDQFLSDTGGGRPRMQRVETAIPASDISRVHPSPASDTGQQSTVPLSEHPAPVTSTPEPESALGREVEDEAGKRWF
jgi:cytoskeletal protein CcmA (bactofilin family)